MSLVHHWGALRKRLTTPSEFVRQVAILAGGTALGQGALLLATPALTRLYTREQIGMIGMLNSFVGIALVAVALCYENAIVMAEDDAEAGRLVALSAIISLVGSACAGVVLVGAALVPGLGLEWLPPWAPLAVAPMVLLAAATTIGRNYLIRFHEYRTVAAVVAAQSVARALAPIALAWTQWGLGALALGEVVGRAVGVGRTCFAAGRRLRAVWEHLRPSALWAAAKKYRKYPLLFLPSSLINVLASQLPVPIVGALYGLEAAGYVALCQLLLSAPIGLISTSVADVFYVRAVEYARADPKRLPDLVRSTAGGLLRLGLAPAILAMLAVPLLAGFVFGQEWAETGRVLAAMIPMTLAATVVSPVSRMVLVAQRQEIKLIYDGVSLASVVGALCGGGALGWSFTASIGLMSGLIVLCYAVYYGLMMMLARRMATGSLAEASPQT